MSNEVKMEEEFKLKELANLIDPDKMSVLVYDKVWFFNPFPFYFESEAKKKVMSFTRLKNIPKPSFRNLAMKAYRDDEIAMIKMAYFRLNNKSDQGYAIAEIYDKVHNKRAFVEFWVEGIGMWYLEPDSSLYDFFDRGRSILKQINWQEVNEIPAEEEVDAGLEENEMEDLGL